MSWVLKINTLGDVLPGVPVRICVRREALPVKLRALRSGGVVATVRDPSEDLVPKSPKQVETPTGNRAGSRQHGARRRRRPTNDARTDRLPPTFATRRQCSHPGVRYPTLWHAHRNRKSYSTFPSCVGRISVPAELSNCALLSTGLQRSLLFSIKHCLIVWSIRCMREVRNFIQATKRWCQPKFIWGNDRGTEGPVARWRGLRGGAKRPPRGSMGNIVPSPVWCPYSPLNFFFEILSANLYILVLAVLASLWE